VKDPKKRFPAESLLSHPWIEENQNLCFDTFEEVHNIIKKHNMSHSSSAPDLTQRSEETNNGKDGTISKAGKETLVVVEDPDSESSDTPPKSPRSYPSPRSRSGSTCGPPSKPPRNHKRNKSNTRKLELPVTEISLPVVPSITSPKKKFLWTKR